MHLRLRIARTLLAALLALAFVTTARGATADNNVEWAGVSHVPTMDRRPLCPVAGETFQVRVQTWRNDLTSASVHVIAGASITDVPATRIGVRGPYDLWAAQVPATASNTESYWVTLTDGSLTDYLSVSGLGHTAPVDGGFPMDFTTFVHAPAGSTPVTGGGAVFKVWAPSVTYANVKGDWNSWAGNLMTKVGEYFTARIPSGVADRANYKYYFASPGGYATDPRARQLNSGNNYNSYVENPLRYAWGDSGYVFPSLDSLVIYQLNIGTFCGLNDPYGTAPQPSGYRDVAGRVGHLKDLGVNAVMINPINEFPGDWSAGYNPITAFSLESKYGTPDDFKYLVDVLHQAHIAVIMDIVWNHMSPTDNFLWNYDGVQEYFENPDVQTSWGSQCAFGKQGVADYYANSAQAWYDEYHLDGFRMDATSAMTQGVHSLSGWQLMQRLNTEKANRWADRFTIAEQLPSNSAYTQPVSSNGAGFDAQYQMLWRDNLRTAMFAAAAGDPNMNDVRSALVGSGTWISGMRAVNYIELHDEAWPSSGGQRMVKNIDTTAPYDDIYAQGRTKLAQGLTLTSQGIPAMLMGDEWLESVDFGASAGNRIDWSRKITYAPIFHFYQKLISLRRWVPALRASAATYVSHVNESGNVIAYRRLDGAGNPVMVIANFSNTNFASYRIGVPTAGTWTELVNSQDPQYGGSGPANPGALATDAIAADVWGQSLAIALPKMTFAVLAPFSYVGVTVPRPATELQLSAPWPNPTRGASRLSYTLPTSTRGSLAILDVAGRTVRTLADGALEAGAHTVAWDGADAAGRTAAPGLYFVRLSTTLGSRTARLAIVQ
jgi:1,4-alpha-glucan branching enzyme